MRHAGNEENNFYHCVRMRSRKNLGKLFAVFDAFGIGARSLKNCIFWRWERNIVRESLDE
jgi:hypothetical protein